jgi:hypothetical protein
MHDPDKILCGVKSTGVDLNGAFESLSLSVPVQGRENQQDSAAKHVNDMAFGKAFGRLPPQPPKISVANNIHAILGRKEKREIAE